MYLCQLLLKYAYYGWPISATKLHALVRATCTLTHSEGFCTRRLGCRPLTNGVTLFAQFHENFVC